MACGCAADKPAGLILGGRRLRRRSQRRNRRRSRRWKQVGSKKTRVMRGGLGTSLLGDPASNVMNFTSKLLGTPGAPSMPWNQPANFSHRYGNSYFV